MPVSGARSANARAGIIAAAAMLLGSWSPAAAAAPRGSSGEAVGRGTRGHAAKPPAVVHFSCGEGDEVGALADPRQAEALASLAGALTWEGGYGLPSDCHRQVRLVCGPDLDGDGDREGIVQVGWWHAIAGNSCASLRSSEDYWPVTYTFLVARHRSTWRAISALGSGVFAEELDAAPAAQFVKLPRRQVGVLVHWANVASENGCQIAGYEIFAFRDGALKKLQTQDQSPPCTPCCERP